MKKRGLAFLLVFCLIMSLMLNVNGSRLMNIKAATGSDVSEKVSNIKVSIKSMDGNTYYVKDNVSTGEAMYNGTHYIFNIAWAMSEDVFRGKVSAGDYFYIDLDGDSFIFESTTLDNDLIYQDEVIGKWGITSDNKIYCEFTENAEDSISVSGTFEAEGELDSDNRDSATIKIGGSDIDVVVNPTNLPELEVGGSAVSKYGTNYLGQDTVIWHILVNYALATQYYVNGTDTVVEGVKVIDNLPTEDNDLIMDSSSIVINTPINLPTKNSSGEYVLSSVNATNVDLTSLFEVVDQEDSEEKNEWLERLNTKAENAPEDPFFGFSSDGKTAIIYAGKLPGSLVYADDSTFNTILSSITTTLSDDEKAALKKIYGETINGKTVYRARGLDITLGSKPESGEFQYEDYVNDVTIEATNPSVSDTITADKVKINKISGDIVVSKPKTATLTKTDYNTGKSIKGAKFKLQVKKDGVWTDYDGTELVTDSDGKIEVNELGSGTYRFYETEAATGYDIDSYTAKEFEISDTDTEGKDLTATNKVKNIDISVTKVWDDESDKDKVRPDSITVKLMNGSTVVKTATLTKKDNASSSDSNKWTYKFEDLPVYDINNKAIKYTVVEDEVTGYTSSVSKYTITNTHEVETETETESSTDPTTESTDPTTESTDPTTESTDPTTESTDPTTESTDPTTESTDPTTESTDPSTESTEITTEPTTDPTTEPVTDPTTESTDPSTESTEITTEPVTDPTTEEDTTTPTTTPTTKASDETTSEETTEETTASDTTTEEITTTTSVTTTTAATTTTASGSTTTAKKVASSGENTAVNTGDSNTFVWIALMLASVLGVTACSRKRENE